jgi:hypothetical protein
VASAEASAEASAASAQALVASTPSGMPEAEAQLLASHSPSALVGEVLHPVAETLATSVPSLQRWPMLILRLRASSRSLVYDVDHVDPQCRRHRSARAPLP